MKISNILLVGAIIYLVYRVFMKKDKSEQSDFNGRGSISTATQIPVPGGPLPTPPCCSAWCVSAGKNKSDSWLGFCVRKHCK